jgi:transcriptional regulator with XRE-family HTH domain
MPVRTTDDRKVEEWQRINELVGGRIRFRRRELEMTLEDLGKRIGRQGQWVAQVERGRIMPTYIDLGLICKALEYPMTRLLTGLPGLSSERTPRNADDWFNVFPDNPARAQAHASLDAVMMSATRTSPNTEAAEEG